MWASVSPHALLSLPIVSECLWKSCTGTCELLPRAVWLFFNGLFARNILYLFIQDQQQKAVYTSGSLQQHLRRGFQRKKRRSFHTVSHLRIATQAFLLISSIFVTFLYLIWPLSTLPFLHLFLSFICHPPSTDHWNWYDLDRTISLCFSCAVCRAPSATLCHKCQCFSAIVEHLQKPIKCQPHSSIATSVNCSHLEMSMSKPQCDGAGSWKSESTAPILQSCKDLTLMLATGHTVAPLFDPCLWPQLTPFTYELIIDVQIVVKTLPWD